MSVVYYAVTPSNCAQGQDCGGQTPCTPQPGECLYYSSTYLSGPNIQNGDNFNTVVTKLSNYIASLDVGLLASGINLGAGVGIYSSASNNVLNFKSLVAGSGILLSPLSDSITISTTGLGSEETATNVGFQTEVYKVKAGNEFQFRTLIGDRQLETAVIGDNVRIRYNNLDKFIFGSDSVRVYPAGTYIEKIVVYPQATMSSFKVGTTPGDDDIVIEQPIAGLEDTTITVEKYLRNGATLYFEGLNSSTEFIVFKEIV